MGPLNIVFHEFKAMSGDMKRAPGLINKIKYMLYPPGWSHNGSSQTAKIMQKELMKSGK